MISSAKGGFNMDNTKKSGNSGRSDFVDEHNTNNNSGNNTKSNK